MPDRKPPFAESLLARTVGPERASAIYGDLLELAATRGRLWFSAAFARTLIAVSWRAPVALICGVLATLGLVASIVPVWRHIAPDPHIFPFPSWFHRVGPLLASTVVPLWFLLTYAWIRYGRYDRFVRLTATLTVTMTFTLLYAPWVSGASGVLSLLIATSAMLHPLWRRPMLVLCAATTAGHLGLTWAISIRAAIPSLTHFERPLLLLLFRLTTAAVLAAEAYVCSRTYRALLKASRSADRQSA